MFPSSWSCKKVKCPKANFFETSIFVLQNLNFLYSKTELKVHLTSICESGKINNSVGVHFLHFISLLKVSLSPDSVNDNQTSGNNLRWSLILPSWLDWLQVVSSGFCFSLGVRCPSVVTTPCRRLDILPNSPPNKNFSSFVEKLVKSIHLLL